MYNYPSVNYIGNKSKISSWIADNIPKECSVIVDMFSGGSSVSYELKKRNYTIISNDILYSNYVLSKALIENNSTKLFIADIENINIDKKDVHKKYQDIKFLTNLLYYDFEVKELAQLLLISEHLSDNKKYIFLSLLRRAMIRKIPYSRMNIKWNEIVKLRDEKYSYEKYGRYRSYHNQTFLHHIKHYLNEYNNAIFSNNKHNVVYQKDCLDLAHDLSSNIDLIYLDPPYPSTMNNYNAFYGYFDIINNKNLPLKTDLTSKKTFLINLEKIIKIISKKTKYLMISVNNKTNPSSEDICKMLEKYTKNISIKTKNHVYKLTGKENKHNNYEILILAHF